MIIRFILIVLATWRITSLLVYEDGPFDMFGKFRSLAGVRYDDFSDPYGTNTFARGLMCFWCTSVWVSLIWCIIGVISQHIGWFDFLVAWFSISALSIIINEIVQRLKRK